MRGWGPQSDGPLLACLGLAVLGLAVRRRLVRAAPQSVGHIVDEVQPALRLRLLGLLVQEVGGQSAFARCEPGGYPRRILGKSKIRIRIPRGEMALSTLRIPTRR